jgi:hypothetical protein
MSAPLTTKEYHKLLFRALKQNISKLTVVNLVDTISFVTGNPNTDNCVYGRRLGKALQNNTHVSRLLLPVFLGHIAPRGVTPSPDHIAMLLSFIRNSTSLREVFLAGWDWDATDYAGYLIDAVADSQHVMILRIWNHMKYPPSSMARLLRTNTTLKELCLTVVQSGGVLSAALKLNQSIETLYLDCLNREPLANAEAVEMVLALRDHQSLRKLSLRLGPERFYGNTVRALSSILATLSNLADLALDRRLCKEEMDLLVEGLHGNQSIKKLHLTGNFAPSAATAFADYMQSRNGIDTSRITSLTLCLISFSSEEVCDSDLLISDLLKGPYGGGLQSVELMEFQVPGLWNVLLKETPSKNLRSLKLHCDRRDRVECLKYLPELVFLQKLEFQDMGCPVPLVNECDVDECKVFCEAVKKNGSLHKVSVTTRLRNGTKVSFEDWDANVVRAVKAWGKRNRHLPQLLANPIDIAGASRCDNRGAISAANAPNNALFPTLFWVAKQAPRMAPAQLLLGLLALDDVIEPRAQAPLRVAP